MTDLHCQRSFSASLFFHVLSHLKLHRDAASLYFKRRHVPPWVEPLFQAYRLAPGRTSFQFVGLEADGVEELLQRLEQKTGEGPPADQRLAAALCRAVLAEEASYHETWRSGSEREEARLLEWQVRYATILQALRTGLWAAGTPPPLTLLDCRSLGAHGRGMTLPGGHRVAVSFAHSDEHVLFQTFHEEVHPISDPVMLNGLAGGVIRCTEAGQPGHELHRHLECAALELGEAVVAARQPQLLGAYRAWRLEGGKEPSALRRWLQEIQI